MSRIFRIHVPQAGNVGVIDAGKEFLPFPGDLYEGIGKGMPLPINHPIEIDIYSKNKAPSKDFLNFGPHLLASDDIDPRMRDMLALNCHVIQMIASFGSYTYYLPKALIDAIDRSKSELRKYNDDDPVSDNDFSNLVIDDNKVGDVPIFQLLPVSIIGANYVTEEFVKLYKECRCKGIRFIPIDTTSQFIGNA